MSDELIYKPLQEEYLKSEKDSLHNRMSMLKMLPEDTANEMIINDKELQKYLKEKLELKFYKGFATLGILIINDDDCYFEIKKSDIKNNKFEYNYHCKLYASLGLINKFANRKRLSFSEEDVNNLIDKYYMVTENMLFYLDSSEKKVTQTDSICNYFQKWIDNSNNIENSRIEAINDEKEILNDLDKESINSVSLIANTIEGSATEELLKLFE